MNGRATSDFGTSMYADRHDRNRREILPNSLADFAPAVRFLRAAEGPWDQLARHRAEGGVSDVSQSAGIRESGLWARLANCVSPAETGPDF